MVKTIAYNIDCMEYMATLPDKAFDLALVEPPYRNINEPTKDMRNNNFIKDFGNKPDNTFFKELFRVSKEQIIWGANNFTLPNYKGFVVWEKTSIPEKFTMSMAEIAYLSEGLGTVSKIFKHRSQDPRRIHPTQKPVALYEWLLMNYTNDGDKILDTHLGSGSSRIAAHRLGFEFVGCELDKDYFKAQEKRFKLETMQKSLFV